MGSDSARSAAGSGGKSPAISAAVTPPQLIVTGHRFSPHQWVTIRVIDSDEMTNYFEYLTDAAGDLVAALPTSISRGILQISATDGQADPGDETGLRWTNTDTMIW